MVNTSQRNTCRMTIRSNSLSSVEEYSKDEEQIYTAPNTPEFVPDTSTQTIDDTSILDDMKGDIKDICSALTRMEEKLDRHEKRSIRIEEKLDVLLCGFGHIPQSMPATPLGDNLPTIESALQNEISEMIRTSIRNQKVDNIAWNLDESVNHPDNIVVSKNIADFVCAHITESKGMHWAKFISRSDIHKKIVMVFRRHKTSKNMPIEKKLRLKKINTRKTRRVTKCNHRKDILSHNIYGKTLREIFGDDVENLAIEQLQSDEESTDSQGEENERSAKLKVSRPTWRSEKGEEAFRKFDEFDLIIRKNARKERETRYRSFDYKVSDVKQKYLDKAPGWAKASVADSISF